MELRILVAPGGKSIEKKTVFSKANKHANKKPNNNQKHYQETVLCTVFCFVALLCTALGSPRERRGQRGSDKRNCEKAVKHAAMALLSSTL